MNKTTVKNVYLAEIAEESVVFRRVLLAWHLHRIHAYGYLVLNNISVRHVMRKLGFCHDES
jgi:hypothetical protein